MGIAVVVEVEVERAAYRYRRGVVTRVRLVENL